MSSIADGLTVGGEAAEKPEGVISSNEEFMASLARDLGEDPASLAGDEPPVAPAVPAPAGETAPVPEGDNSATPAAEEEFVSREQYDNLQTLMGRMSNELGELRKAVAPPEADENDVAPTPIPVTPDVLDQIETALETTEGQELAYWALTSAPHLYEAVLDAWADQGGSSARKAAEFNMRYQQALEREEATTIEEQEKEFRSGLAVELDKMVSELAPQYGITPGTPEIDTLLGVVVTEAPESIQKLVVSHDATERADGIKTILALAAARLAVPTTPDEGAGAALAAALAETKKAAGLGTGSQQRQAPAAPEDAPKNPQNELIDGLRAALLETPTTSVSAGLTFGNQ